MIIVKHDVQRILVDSKSLTDVLFYDTFIRMTLFEVQLK